MLAGVEGLWNVHQSESVGSDGAVIETFDVVKVVALHVEELADDEGGVLELMLRAVDWQHVNAREYVDLNHLSETHTIFIPERSGGESQHEVSKALWTTVESTGCDCSRQTEVAEVAPGLWRGTARHHEGCRKARKAAKRSRAKKSKKAA